MSTECVTYLFDSEEIAFMASSMGYRTLTGFDFGETAFGADEAVNILSSLVNRGVYENTQEHFRLNEPFRVMITMMCECGQLLCIRFVDDSRSELCCYLSEGKMLVCSLFCGKTRLTLTDESGLWELMLSDGALPPEKDGLQHRLPQYTAQELSELLSDGMLCGDNEITVWMERKNTTLGISADIILAQRALGNVLITRKDGYTEQYPYTKEKLRELLSTLLEMSL